MCLEQKNMSLRFSSSLDALTEHNSSFDKGILRVAYVGRNRNKSSIDRDVFERCMDSIYNCPIVCNYDRATDEIGSHDMELVKGDDGSIRLVNITDPVGVVPAGAKTWFDTVVEDDGTEHEYLFTEVLLWKRQEAYKKIKEDGITDESMEINVKSGHMENGVYIIDDFEFTAFCLLGTAEPCYESAALMVFSQEDFKAKLSEMMHDVTMAQSPDGVGIHPQNYSEGGDKALDEKKALMAKYGLTEDGLDFNLEDLTLEELTEKFEAMTAGDPADGGSEPADGGEPAGAPDGDPADEGGSNFALVMQFVEELMDALRAETYIDPCWGECTRYWYQDHDPELSEVYAIDAEDWKLYGFTYSMNGDHVVVDFASKKRMKYAIVPFDEGEQTLAFAAVAADMGARYSSVVSERDTATENLNQANTLMAELTTEVEGLRKFKAEADQAEATEKREELFAQFEDIAGTEAFTALQEHAADYSMEDLEEKLFALRGRAQTTAKFSMQEQKAPKLPVETPGAENDEPYGGLFAKYGHDK